MSLSTQVKAELTGRLGKSMEDILRAQSMIEKVIPIIQKADNDISRIPALTAELINSEVQNTIAEAEMLKEQVKNYKLERDEIRRKNQQILIEAAQKETDLKAARQEIAKLKLQLTEAEAKLEAEGSEPLVALNGDSEEE